VRLVYELPVDALQRALQDRPDADLEQVLAGAIDVVRARVHPRCRVSRRAATGFVVDVPAALTDELGSVRRRIGMIGSLEMHIVASDDYAADGVRFDLRQERTRLEQWLDDGGRERVRTDPLAIDAFAAGDARNLRWVPRRIRPDRARPDRWGVSYATLPALQAATVTAYDEAEWNDGKVPPALAQRDDVFLVEFVAINLHAGSFTERDLDPQGIGLAAAKNGGPAVTYSLLDARAKAYSDWSATWIGHCSAIVLNGEVLSAPVFRSRIPGRGIIEGDFTRATANDLVAALRAGELPAPPKLVRQEAMPAAGK
jgi:hypothetical protein